LPTAVGSVIATAMNCTLRNVYTRYATRNVSKNDTEM